jgi:glycosyltransferase involved in cell wall biosynthesis
MKLLMISTDQKMFIEGSDVARRMVEYAKKYEEVHIVVFAKLNLKDKISKITETTLASNCWVYSTQSRAKITYPFDAIRVGRFIITGRKITQITCQDPFLTGMVGVSLKKEFKIPLELQLHTDIGSPYFTRTLKNRIFKALAVSYLPKADHVRVVSQRIRAYLVERLGISRSTVEVRPVMVDVDAIKHMSVTHDLRARYPQFSKIILIASRLEKEKNIRLALDAFVEVTKLLPVNVGLVIVGNGSEVPRIEKYIVRNNLRERVVIESWADMHTLVSYYKTANVFLVTSWYEGYGMTLIEAQAAGCKIVSTDVGVAREAGATIVGYNAREVADAIVAHLS